VGNVSFTAPVRHVHMVENYGLISKTKKHTIAYITDTRYFEELGSYYRGRFIDAEPDFYASAYCS